MGYVTPQGKVPAYTPQRKARFPFPPQGIPIVVPPPPPPLGVWSMFMYDRYHRSVTSVSASVIYFGCDDYNVYALNADGTLKWSFSTGDRIVYASPVVDNNGVIYIGSFDNFLYALNSDGTLRWRFYAEGEVEYSAAVDLASEVIYVGSHAYYIFAISSDGTEKWRYPTTKEASSHITLCNSDIYSCDGNGYMYHLSPDATLICRYYAGYPIYLSAPAIDDYGVIYVGCVDYNLHAINPDCTRKWTFATGYFVVSTPSIDPSGNIYFGSFDKYLYSVKPDGTFRWSFNTEGRIYGGAALSDGVYVGSCSFYLFALTFDGTLKWSYKTGDAIYSTPSIDKDGVIFIGNIEYKMYAFNPDGTVRWTFAVGGAVNSSAAVI